MVAHVNNNNPKTRSPIHMSTPVNSPSVSFFSKTHECCGKTVSNKTITAVATVFAVIVAVALASKYAPETLNNAWSSVKSGAVQLKDFVLANKRPVGYTAAAVTVAALGTLGYRNRAEISNKIPSWTDVKAKFSSSSEDTKNHSA